MGKYVKPKEAKPMGFMPPPHVIAKLLKRSKVDPVTGCWNWTGYIREDGWGEVGIRDPDGKDRKFRVHRVSFEVFVNELKPDEEVHHQCRNRACFNPAHLSAEDPVAHGEESSLYRWTACELVSGPYEGSIRHVHPDEPDELIVIRDKEGIHTYRFHDGEYTYDGVVKRKSRTFKNKEQHAIRPGCKIKRVEEPEEILSAPLFDGEATVDLAQPEVVHASVIPLSRAPRRRQRRLLHPAASNRKGDAARRGRTKAVA